MATDFEEIVANGITFVFENNPGHVEETEELKKRFKVIIPELERYFSNKDYFDRRKIQIEKSKNTILVYIIKPFDESHTGSIGISEDSHIIIELYPISCYNEIRQRFMFIQTFVHEIFHLFFEDEIIVREKTVEFVKSNRYLNNLWMEALYQ